jgi:hypothetical protein
MQPLTIVVFIRAGHAETKVMTKTHVALAGLLIGLAGFSSAEASETCRNCLVRERTPEIYGVRARLATIRPGATYRTVAPARVAHVRERVVVAPEQVVAHAVPAHVATVRERVEIAPARTVWVRRFDITGREVMCEETVPAQYATQLREVVVPAHTQHVVIPAQTRVVSHAVVRPARVLTHRIPAERHLVPGIIAQAPRSDRWVEEPPRTARRDAAR